MPRPYHRRRHAPARSTPAGGHRPVLLAEVLDALNPQPGQTVVDGTLGKAGHAAALLERVGPDGRLIAFDLDGANLDPARGVLDSVGHPYTLHHGNFAGIAVALAGQQANGILADLGFSSMQVDDADRGFSFMRDGPLDMRMDPTRGTTAAQLLERMPADELAAAFRELGDCDEIAPGTADRIATAVADARGTLHRTGDLADLIRRTVPVVAPKGPRLKGQPTQRQLETRPVAQVFQTLRILVNRELANLTQLLRVAPDLLAPGGVIAVISFHSGEDRIVKAAFRDGLRAGVYDAAIDEPIRASFGERGENPRSRSAKLRWARRATKP